MNGTGYVIKWTIQTGRGQIYCCDSNYPGVLATLKRIDCDSSLQLELDQVNPNTGSQGCPPPSAALTVEFTYDIAYNALAARNVTRT